MTTVVGIRFREVGKIYSFAPGDLDLKRGDHVIAETAKGVEYGTVILGNYDAEEKDIVQPLKTILRKATAEDGDKVEENRKKESEAFRLCKEKIADHKLEMKLIAVEYAFDNSKITFYFTADGRVDFRDLVKDLAALFKNRIELHQVGVRDETKIVGGMGSCGRPLCCNSWLNDFVPVSIRMAKEQNLSLNPQKISGVCGRLMCCLKNEAETYSYLNAKLPKKGDTVLLPDGMQGEVVDLNVLRQKAKVLLVHPESDERELVDVSAEDITVLAHRKKGQPGLPKKELMKKENGGRREAFPHRNPAETEKPDAEPRTAEGRNPDGKPAEGKPADGKKSFPDRGRRERRRQDPRTDANPQQNKDKAADTRQAGRNRQTEGRQQAGGMPDGKAAEQKPAEQRPVNPRRMNPRPAGAKPVNPKPANPKPGDPKLAEKAGTTAEAAKDTAADAANKPHHRRNRHRGHHGTGIGAPQNTEVRSGQDGTAKPQNNGNDTV